MKKLEIRRGVASKSFENTFFREFAKELEKMFNEESIEGLLIGFPACKVEKTLQIDVLLITTNTIFLIDLKSHGGEITLPKYDNFDKGEWCNGKKNTSGECSNRQEKVKGGSQKNKK